MEQEDLEEARATTDITLPVLPGVNNEVASWQLSSVWSILKRKVEGAKYFGKVASISFKFHGTLV